MVENHDRPARRLMHLCMMIYTKPHLFDSKKKALLQCPKRQFLGETSPSNVFGEQAPRALALVLCWAFQRCRTPAGTQGAMDEVLSYPGSNSFRQRLGVGAWNRPMVSGGNQK